jgi:putative N6-adenine-specific DNA methylase
VSDSLSLFAATAPGLEPIAAGELRRLGIAGAAEDGGVFWEGGLPDLYAASLHLRTASRVLVRAAAFRARSFHELERHADRVPWERFVPTGGAVRLRVTSRKSRLYHEGAIAERLLRAVERRVGAVDAGGERDRDGDAEAEAEAQLFVVRFVRDAATISADASGALLHRRGYRQALAKAPLRETLAAAMLLASGWREDAPLLDPMCGSGTIPIEAALLARRIPPGLAGRDRAPRDFAFLRWPGFDAERWAETVERARDAILPAATAPIVASDRDAGAVEAARANAARAGVEGDVELLARPLSALEAPAAPGWLVTNPPYGLRVGESAPLRNLYAALGRVARGRLRGWTVALLSADRAMERQTGLRLTEALRTRNGGIPVRLMVEGPEQGGSG